MFIVQRQSYIITSRWAEGQITRQKKLQGLIESFNTLRQSGENISSMILRTVQTLLSWERTFQSKQKKSFPKNLFTR